MISLQAQPQSAILPILALIIVSLTIIWILNKDRINVKTPKKLWLLRSYIKFLNFFVALILIGYIGFSIYNLFGSGSTILSFLIGAGGVYIVLVSLSVLLVAQTIMLFIGIHDNVDDIRKKTLDPEFMVDLTAEKQKDQSNALNSLFLLVVICLAILCSILNMTVGVEVKNRREYDNSRMEEKAQQNQDPIFNSTRIIGTPISIGFGLAAQYDFPEEMDWNSASIACAALGNGWRLPTIRELTVMMQYNHQNQIDMSEDKGYWSSEESDSQQAITYNIEPFVESKEIKYKVRAVSGGDLGTVGH